MHTAGRTPNCRRPARGSARWWVETAFVGHGSFTWQGQMVTDGRTSDVCSLQLTPDFIKNSCRKTPPPPTDKAVDRTTTPAPTLSFPVSERQAAGSQLTIPPVQKARCSLTAFICQVNCTIASVLLPAATYVGLISRFERIKYFPPQTAQLQRRCSVSGIGNEWAPKSRRSLQRDFSPSPIGGMSGGSEGPRWKLRSCCILAWNSLTTLVAFKILHFGNLQSVNNVNSYLMM